MKKIIFVLFFLVILIINKNEEYIIPNDALRFRVIANSNTIEDQNTKIQIKSKIEDLLATSLLNTTSKAEAEEIVNQKIPDIKNIVDKYQIPYNINLGQNYFPQKTYRGVTYKEGLYDSLVITLGNGAGENWWCVLYPPLCFMDKYVENNENIEYKSFVKEIFKKYL